MPYTTEHLEAIASKLRDMPPIERKKPEYSKQAAVKMLVKEITTLQKRGYSLEQIAETLRGEGLDVATPTLKNYLQRARPTRKKTPAKASPHTVQPVSSTPVDTGTMLFTPKPDTDDI